MRIEYKGFTVTKGSDGRYHVQGYGISTSVDEPEDAMALIEQIALKR